MAKKLQYAITYFFIGIVIVACLFFSGCNPSKKAARKAAKLERKAEKHLYKSISLDPMPFTIECAQKFNPIDSIHERIIYKPGETIRDTIVATEIDIIQDTVYITKYRTVTVKQTDTVDLSRFQTESNKAAQDSVKNYYERIVGQLRDDLGKSQVSEAKTKEQRNMWRIAALALAGYTLLRWLLRYFTKGRINIP